MFFKKIQKIKDNLENLEMLDEDFSASMYEVLGNLLNSKVFSYCCFFNIAGIYIRQT